MKLLLFDLDGTLLLTSGAGMRAMGSAAAELFGDQFSFDGVIASGHLDPLIFAEATALNAVAVEDGHHDRFRETYLRELAQELAANPAGVHVMPGIPDLLASLVDHPHALLGLLTGNYTQAVPIKLQAARIDPSWFRITAFGDEAPDRSAMVRLAMERYAAHQGKACDPCDVIIIGDTPRDIACAKANGCQCLAVATGRYSEQELQEAGADLTLPDLSDPTPLWDMIGCSASA